FEVGDLRVAFGVGIFFGIMVVNAIHFGGLKNHFGADLVGAQGGGRIGGKIGVAGSATEDHHASFFEVADGAAADKSFSNLGHGDGGLHARGHAELFQRVLQGQRVDDSGQHAHVITGGAFDAPLAACHPAI